MNKSKFLKKSLAMLLALMLVVAMIPLSASAAPSDTFAPSAIDGQKATVTETADGWNMEFEYVANPKVIFKTAGTGETVQYVNKDNQTVNVPATGVELWFDGEDPVPLTIKVTNGGETTEHVIRWSVLPAAGVDEVSVASAKIGDSTNGYITGTVNETAKTIDFVIPFGVNWGANDIEVTFNNVKNSGAQKPASLTVETNTTKGAAGTITVQPQNDEDDITYTVNVRQEDALTAITLGDYEGVFQIQPDNNANAGKETGEIVFTVPASTKATDLENLVTNFTVASSYNSIQYNDGSNKHDMINGEKGDYSAAYTASKEIVLTNAYGGSRTYNIIFRLDNKDTTVTAVTATIGGKTYDGTVDGDKLDVVVPANSDLSNVTVTLTGPSSLSGETAVVVIVSSGAEYQYTGDKATITGLNYAGPVQLQVKSANGEVYGYYTLTITKATSENNNPQVSSAKLVINKGKTNEYTASGSIDHSAKTITFTVPYSTTNAMLSAGEYTFGKTAQTSFVGNKPEAPTSGDYLKDGASITVKSNDNDTTNKYTIKFERMAAQTGKSISNFTLSTADNVNEKGYNNNKDFAVTASGSEFKVTLPKTSAPTTLYPDFELSQGAELYAVAKDADTAKSVIGTTLKSAKVLAYDTTDGDFQTALTGDQIKSGYVYVIVDETLSTAIANGEVDSLTYDQIKNKYKTNYAEYTLKVTEEDEKGHRLTALSANDNKVTSSFSGNDGSVINLSVPYSYANTANKEFFFDFTVDKGATFVVTKTSKANTTIYSGGMVNYNTSTSTLESVDSTFPNYGKGNVAFKVAKNASDEYALYVGSAKDNGNSGKWVEITNDVGLAVIAENGASTSYTIGTITVRDAETGGELTSAKVNNTQATINQTNDTVSVVLPLGTNPGQVKLTLVADEMADIKVGNAAYDASKTYDVTKPLTIVVTSEDGKTTTDYTLTATIAEQFSDVNPEDWFYNNVMAAVDAGIVSGQGDGIFNPYGQVTRRDFAIMVVKLLLNGEEPEEAETTPFTDVADDDYALNAIAYCAENGIISGYEGEFRPGDKITRQEAAAVMRNALELADASSDIELFSDDAKIASWAKGNVYACKAAGIFTGDNMGNFNATSSLTRAEAASIMVNAMNK